MRARLDRWQRRHATAAFALGVVRKFTDDRASSLAALVAYYAFFSLFPLLLVFVSMLGFVLDGDPELRAVVLDSALGRIPVIGTQIGADVEPLSGSGAAMAIGLAVLVVLGTALVAASAATGLATGGGSARPGSGWGRSRCRSPSTARSSLPGSGC
jgi:membrane protein